MKAIIGVAIGLTVGGAVGYLVGSKLTEKKCRDICEQEIASVKAAFSKDYKITIEDVRTEAEEKAREAAEKAKNKPDILKYSEVVKKAGYNAKYGKIFDELRTSTKGDDKEFPYVITPEEYGELPDYEQSSLIYYEEDGVVATESDDIVEGPDEVVGLDSLKHLGEYANDSVYVRNDRLKCDYEILRDPGSFEEMMKNKPYAHEDDDE